VFDEMDELHAQRVERRNPTWFPRGGGHELARLARRRRRERAIPSG
jgi:GH24 family phage-related lysozyme (muramidase)